MSNFLSRLHKKISSQPEKPNKFFPPKQVIGHPDSTDERQANTMAKKAMQVTDTENSFFISAPKHIQRKCAHCDEENNLQLKADRKTKSEMPVPTIVNAAVSSAGQSLDIDTRHFMESRFGHDFGNVKVHNDQLAHRSSAYINALAYTNNNHIVFGSGQYQPNTNTGRELLAHELVHVVQQRNNAETNLVNRKPVFNDACDNYQRCLVIEALAPAKRLVDNAIKMVQPIAKGNVSTGNIVNELDFHFKAGAVANARKIVDNFKLIRSELDNNITYNCFAEDPDGCKSAEGFVGALTDCAAGDEIDLCHFYFIMNCTEQARQLVHENAHHLGFCYDYAYADQANYATISHAEAMKNPDTYAQFAKSVYPGAPACKNCAREIQVKNKRY